MARNCIYLDFCCVNWLKLNHVWFCFLNRNSRCSTWRVQRKSLHLQPTLKTAQMTRLSTFLQRSVYADILLPPVHCVFLSKVMYFFWAKLRLFPSYVLFKASVETKRKHCTENDWFCEQNPFYTFNSKRAFQLDSRDCKQRRHFISLCLLNFLFWEA